MSPYNIPFTLFIFTPFDHLHGYSEDRILGNGADKNRPDRIFAAPL